MKSITLPYPPSANVYWRNWRGRMVVSNESRRYKKNVGLMALAAGFRAVNYPIGVSIDIYRPKRQRDLDNCIKVLLDSLKGIAFVDDDQVVELSARRFDDKANPRAVVTITQLETHGSETESK